MPPYPVLTAPVNKWTFHIAFRNPMNYNFIMSTGTNNKISPLKILFCLFLLLGCDKPLKEKTINEYTFYVGNPASSRLNIDYFDTAIGALITKHTGVTLKTSYVRGNNTEQEAIYMTATEDYPDIIYAFTALDIFVNNGALIPLNDLIDTYGPNIKKYYGNLLNIFANDEGIIYYIGSNYVIDSVNYPKTGFYLPIELLREEGWPKVESFDQYVELIRKYAKKYPTFNGEPVIGFSTVTAGTKFNTLILGAAKLMGYPNMGDSYVVSEEPLKLDLIVRSGFAKKYFRTLNSLWNEGLVDKALFSQSYDQYVNKIATGKVIGIFDYYWHILPSISRLAEKGLYHRSPIPFPVMFSESSSDTYVLSKEIFYDEGVGISINCKDPVGVMKFWNRMLEDDIQKFIYWGMERVHYYKDKSKGTMKKTPEQFRTLWVPENGLLRFIKGFPQRDQRSFYDDGNPVSPLILPGYTKYNSPRYIRKVLDAYNINTFHDLFTSQKDLSPGFGNIPVIDKSLYINSVTRELEKVTRHYLVLLISCATGEFDSTWNEFQSKLGKLNLKAYIDYRARIYEKVKGKLERSN